MAATAKKTDAKLWQRIKDQVTAEDKGGKPGQWSARKAQLATHEYKSRGGQYEGGKSADNHLSQWTKEEWGTGSGEESGKTGERYLPRRARDRLSDQEYDRTSAKKRADNAAGRQFSAQPADIARKTARSRRTAGDGSRAELLGEAARRGIKGRSRMTKVQLRHALGDAA